LFDQDRSTIEDPGGGQAHAIKVEHWNNWLSQGCQKLRDESNIDWYGCWGCGIPSDEGVVLDQMNNAVLR
jgi:hypothetical protein